MARRRRKKKVVPFANGSEYEYWQDCNCCQCGKATWDENWYDMADAGTPYCPIQRALSAACVGSGEINRRMAVRAGLLTGWACGERVHESQWDESMWREKFVDPNQVDIFNGLPIRNKKSVARPLP